MLSLRVLLLLLVALPAWGALDGRQQELEEVRGRIEQLKKEIEQASEDREEAADALKKSEGSISDVNRTLRELQSKQRKLKRELASLEVEAGKTRTELAAQQERLSELLRARYLQGGNDTLKMLLSGSNPAEASRNMEYLRYVGQMRSALIRDYQASLDRLQELEAKVREKSSSLRQVSDEHQQQKKQLVTEKVERKTVWLKLSTQIRSQRQEVDTLVRDERRLARLIDKLARLAAKEAAKAKSRRGESVTQVADASLAGYAFAKLKGKLALPVAGQILSRFGEPRDGGGPAWKGLFIRSPLGREVRAVGTGKVAFADWLRGFGNLLIVDHGGGYLSLYSNNESLYKQVGDQVKAGDAVAAVGNTGGQEEPGLYFELRHEGRPFDPLSWVTHK